MLDKYIVAEGYERNILVFDGDANPGELTTRLIPLLMDVAWRNEPRGRIEAVYVPEEVEFDPDCNGTYCGAYIIPDKRLNKDGELFKHFQEIGGRLMTGDKYLAVGVGPGLVLLGSF